MSKKDKGTLVESPAERALMDNALQRYQRYKTTWQPVQQQAIQMVQRMGQPGSFERGQAVTRAAGEVGAGYDQATQQLEDSMAQRGVDTGDSAYRMQSAGATTERAKAQGIAGAGAEGAIDAAYLEGLSSVMNLGRQQSNMAVKGEAATANTTFENNRTGALEGAMRRSRNAGLVGMAGGLAASGISANIGTPQGGAGTGFGFSGENRAAPFTPGIDI